MHSFLAQDGAVHYGPSAHVHCLPLPPAPDAGRVPVPRPLSREEMVAEPPATASPAAGEQDAAVEHRGKMKLQARGG